METSLTQLNVTSLVTIAKHQDLTILPEQKKLKVLVVEDDEAQWELWRHVLKTSGIAYTVDFKKTQEAAQSLIVLAFESHRPYDLVISDVFLEGDGTGIDIWNRYGEATGKFVFVTGKDIDFNEFYHKINFGNPVLFTKPISAGTGREIIQGSVAKNRD